MTPIAEILRHPRYREFAAACTECGRQIVPDSFPWRYMGMTVEQFLALPLQYANGRPVADTIKPTWLRIVRAHERCVERWWEEWLAEQPPEPASREAALQEINPCRLGAQGLLF